MNTCKNCYVPIKDINKYCSNKCQQAYERKEYLKKWFAGEVDGNRGKSQVTLSRHVRNYLLETADYRCSLCGWGKKNEFSGTVPLEIDHIDGNPMKSTPDNLRVLCPNCHSLTERHVGKGRRYFRIKYHKEKQA